jgi:apolipoprotein N-acyltransferase
MPTIFIALIPVLYFVYSGKGKGLKYFFLTALIASFISLFEVRHYSFSVYLLGIFITALFAVAFLFISKKLIHLTGKGILSLFIPPAVWTALCLAFNYRSLLTGTFDMGIALPYTAPLIWYIGSIGITYLVILWSSALARSLAMRDKFSVFTVIAVTAILLTSIHYSFTADVKKLAGGAKPVKVSLIQNNISKSWKWLQENPYRVLKVNQGLTNEAAEESPDIIVWSEYSLPVDITNSHGVIRDAVSEVARDGNAKLIVGSILFDRNTGWHDDAALVLNARGKIVDERSSVTPAPFNKYTRSSGRKLKPVDNFGTVICWEELGPYVSREYVNNGAEFLLAIANNQDFDNAHLKFYTPFYSRARAAENMRYFARATNTGLTQVVDPVGRVVKSLKADAPGVLTAEIYPIQKKTFYTKKGPLAVVLADILVGFCLVFALLRRSGSYEHLKRSRSHKNF